MNASRFALVDLAFGVVLLGLLPPGDISTPGQREPASAPAVSASSNGDLSAKRLDPRVLAIERWKATKQRLHRGASGAPDHVTADSKAESRTVTGIAAAACQRVEEVESEAQPPNCEEMEETTGQLRRAELALLRVLASDGDRSEDRAEQGRNTLRRSPLDELARLISWKHPVDERPQVSIADRPAAGPTSGSISGERR